MNNSYKFLVAISMGAWLAGCGSTGAPHEEAAAAPAVAPLAVAETGKVLGNQPAATAFTKLKDSFGRRAALPDAVGVYELSDVATLSDSDQASRLAAVSGASVNAARSGFGPSLRKSERVTTAGNFELKFNQESGSEVILDKSEFHHGEGIEARLLPTDVALLQSARNYATTKLAGGAAGKNMYSYRLSKYYNGSADKLTGATTKTVYQVTAVFNEMIGNVPVIGPGGKLVVHMKPDGRVIGHEATTRPTRKLVRSLSAPELLTPDEALAKAEAGLKARGLTLQDVTVTRSEFGYFRYGRNALQKYLAPHYAFFFQPIANKDSKVLVEIVQAVKAQDLAALIESDEALDRARKAAKAGNVVNDHKK